MPEPEAVTSGKSATEVAERRSIAVYAKSIFRLSIAAELSRAEDLFGRSESSCDGCPVLSPPDGVGEERRLMKLLGVWEVPESLDRFD